MYVKCTWDIRELYVRCTRDAREMYARCTWYVREMYVICTWDVREMYVICTWDVREMWFDEIWTPPIHCQLPYTSCNVFAYWLSWIGLFIGYMPSSISYVNCPAPRWLPCPTLTTPSIHRPLPYAICPTLTALPYTVFDTRYILPLIKNWSITRS